MKAMILAAGYGTRLRPLTYTLPKPMVPVCNRPLIAYSVEAFLRAGIREIVVNLHHLPEAIERELRTRFRGDCRFEFSYEPRILGTGGGLRNVRPQLDDGSDFFLVNGDTIQFPRWEALLEARRQRDALAALTLRHRPESDRFTPVWFDEGLVTGFGQGRGQPLMFSGSHAISARVFGYLPGQECSGIVDDVYRPLLGSGREAIAGVIDDGPWFDIGTPQRYLAASRALLELTIGGQVELARHSRIEGQSIMHDSARGRATRSSVGARSTIEGEVRDSVVWDDCRIAPGIVLDSSIVAHGVELAEPMELGNALICRDDPAIPREAGYRYERGLVIANIS
jgi:mannose-1-phosphate guanylyltransferase